MSGPAIITIKNCETGLIEEAIEEGFDADGEIKYMRLLHNGLRVKMGNHKNSDWVLANVKRWGFLNYLGFPPKIFPKKNNRSLRIRILDSNKVLYKDKNKTPFETEEEIKDFMKGKEDRYLIEEASRFRVDKKIKDAAA